MTFKELWIKISYSSDYDDILNDFYIPVLTHSIEYNRLSGFFSSKSLAVAAKGIISLINNGGMMKLITSPRINPEDYKVILDANLNPMKYIEQQMLNELDNITEEFVKDHIAAMGWMLANKKLEMKIAIPRNRHKYDKTYRYDQDHTIFHQKVAIFRDLDDNVISFSGSVNESAAGWLGHVEEFKVFPSWNPALEEYLESDISKFNRFWNNLSSNVEVIPLPEAVKRKLISVAPENIDEINLEKWYERKRRDMKLFDYQESAVLAWMENGECGIFEMATGTGKTFSSLGCLNRLISDNEPLLTVIACPQNHLLQQWEREINKFGIKYDLKLFAPGTKYWKDILTDNLINLSLRQRKSVIVLTTHKTFSSRDFISILRGKRENVKILLIADEVHGVGAEKYQKGLIQEYDYRLGLSATPKRFFDESGTETIYTFFKDCVFEFPLEEAINRINPATGETFLTPYRYIPMFVSLTQGELEDYIKETNKITYKLKKQNSKSEELDDQDLTKLFIKRANIIKNAEGKYGCLLSLLDSFDRNQKWTIIYSSPQQIDKVMEITSKRFPDLHRFTAEEGTTSRKEMHGLTEREYILERFAKGQYQMLVAMKCLDEGVDVPPARNAILMASSTNSREYIQRIGRVIRRYPGKTEATIWDMIVVPSQKHLPVEIRELEKKIMEKELQRCEYIAKNALNSADALKKLYEMMY